MEDKLFDSQFETISETINPEETGNDYITEFQAKFPEVYDGKCLKITSKNFSDSIFLFCDKKKKDQVFQDASVTFGTFQLTSILDDYYFFKYSGFEVQGYFMYNAKDNLFYSFSAKPMVSKDRNFIYSYMNHPIYGFILNILVMDYYRELSYGLQGKFDVTELTLTQYKNTNNYSIIMDLQESLLILDDNNNITGNNKCNRKIRIN
jgi:hypothetical protein